jgi:hypothetical protein
MPVSFQAPDATTNGGVLRFSNGGFARTNSSFGRLATYIVEIWVKIAVTIRFTSSQPMMEVFALCIKME